MFNSFNPNPIRRRKIVIYKNILLVDLFILAIGFILSLVAIYLAFSNISLTSLLVGAVPFAVSILLIIPFEGQIKLWNALLLALAFPFKKRVYLKGQKKLLIPYKSINEKNGIIKLKNGQFIRIMHAKGFNFVTLTEQEQGTVLSEYRDFLRQMEVSFSIFATDIKIDYQDNFKLIKQLKRNKSKEDKKIIKIAQDDLKNLANHSKKDQREIFFILYGGSEAELTRLDLFVEQRAANANIDIIPVTSKSKIIMILEKNYGNNQATSLDTLINSKVRFTPNHIKMNHKYISIIAIRQLKFNSELGWLYPFMTYPNSSFIINVEKYNLSKAIKKIDKASSDARGVIDSTNLQSELSKNQKEYELLASLSEQIQGESEILFSTSGYFILEADTKTKLNDKIRNLKGFITSRGAKFSNLTFRQKEGFDGSLLKISKLLYWVTSIEIPSSSLANAFPFHQDHLDDSQGTYLGYSKNGENIFLDIFNLNEIRKNHNVTILGASGGGKTTATTKMVKDLWMRGAKIVIADPQAEYNKLTKSLNGHHVDLGVTSKGKTRINPLEWSKTEDPETAFSEHMLFLESFFRVIFPELTDLDWSELDELIQRLYIKFNISTHSESKDYPILKDLALLANEKFEQIKKNQDEGFKIDIFYKLTSYLNRFTNQNSPESVLWNGKTNFDISEGKLYTFDIHSLKNSQNKRLINAQYHILIKYVFSWMVKNRAINKTQKEFEKFVLLVDEGHMLINEKMPAGIEFLFQMSKTMRKFGGSLMFTTQNIADLLGGSDYIRQKTSAIINNSQYNFLFPMNPDDLGNLQKMNESSSYRFSEEENNYIISGKKGDCLLMLSPMDRKMIHIDVSQKEKLIWKDEGEI